MKRWLHRAFIAFLLSLSLAPASSLAQEGAPAVSFRAEAKSGDVLEVSWFVRNASDVYAFELNIRFDVHRLKWKEAEVPVPGFTVPPIVGEDRVLIAHTMVGPVEGLSGDIRLATLRFERIAPGDARVTLEEAKLVDSEVVSATYAPKAEAIFADTSVQLSDIEGHWAKADILRGVRIGFIRGYPDGTFRPNQSVTRAEFAAMLARALQLPLPQGAAPGFADDGEIPEWAVPYAAAAARAGWFTGDEEGRFRANAPVTRAEMAAVLVRALGGAPSQQAADFADWEAIPDWAKGYVASAAEAGIMKGRAHRFFDPQAQSTRAEAAVAVLRLLMRE